MWTCPNCKIEVEPEFDVCWGCGTSRDGTVDPDFNPESDGIIDEKVYEADLAARREESLVTVATYLSTVEAHVIRARLESEGIRVYVTQEQSSDWLLPKAWGGTKLEVPEREAERARELIKGSWGQSDDEESSTDEDDESE